MVDNLRGALGPVDRSPFGYMFLDERLTEKLADGAMNAGWEALDGREPEVEDATEKAATDLEIAGSVGPV